MERSRSWLVLKLPEFETIFTTLKGSSYPKALGHNDGADEAMPVEGEPPYGLNDLALNINHFRERKYGYYGPELRTKDRGHLPLAEICAQLNSIPHSSVVNSHMHLVGPLESMDRVFGLGQSYTGYSRA